MIAYKENTEFPMNIGGIGNKCFVKTWIFERDICCTSSGIPAIYQLCLELLVFVHWPQNCKQTNKLHRITQVFKTMQLSRVSNLDSSNFSLVPLVWTVISVHLVIGKTI